jgi:glycosyltransferase involved in cell wall biosynthesis
MSEHEGFCIPLIEAMYKNIPILAYAEAAVPETLDGASVIFKEKDYKTIAEMMNQIITDNDIKQNIINAQSKRVQKLQNLNLEKQIIEIVHKLER